MRALSIVAPIILAVLSSPILQQTGTMDRSIPAHDVDAYEKAGPYEHDRLSDRSLLADQIAREREWLWTHWTEKRLGLLMYISYSREGDRAEFFYFVESDKDGRWRVAVRIERVAGDRVNLHCDHFSEYTYSAFAVTRVERHADAQGKHALVPVEEKRSSNDYFLILADKDGKELAQF